MTKHTFRSALLVACMISGLILRPALFAQQDVSLVMHRAGSGFFSNPFSIYSGRELPPVVLDNTARIEDLIDNGKLNLTLADALALALENNLDIAVQRYIPEYSQTDLLRSKAGQSPRGFSGGSTPGGLTSGALGAGISGSGAGSGVGSAGGITGGGEQSRWDPPGTSTPP